MPNREKLIDIMNRHALGSEEVSEALGVGRQYIRSMRCGQRQVSEVMIRLLEFHLGERGPSHPSTPEELSRILDLDERRKRLIEYEMGDIGC